jgi:hypothetical protein
MDHQAVAEMLGNYGEFVGAIAVVGTLIYLAIQVRQSREATIENTKAIRAASYEVYNETSNSYFDYLGSHAASLATMLDRSEADLIWMGLQMKMFNSMEVCFLNHRAGAMDDHVFEGKVGGFKSAMSQERNKRSWIEMRDVMGFSGEFKQFVDSVLIR